MEATYKIDGENKKCQASLVFLDPRNEKQSRQNLDPLLATVDYATIYNKEKKLRYFRARLTIQLGFDYDGTQQVYIASSEKNSQPDRVRIDQKKENAIWSPKNKSPIKSLEFTVEQRKLLLKITYDPVNTPAIDRKKRDEWHQQHHAFIKALKEFKPAPELREISGDLSESIKSALQLFNIEHDKNLASRLDEFDIIANQIWNNRPKWRDKPPEKLSEKPDKNERDRIARQEAAYTKFKALESLHQQLQGSSNSLRKQTLRITTPEIDPNLTIELKDQDGALLLQQSLKHKLEFRPHL